MKSASEFDYKECQEKIRQAYCYRDAALLLWQWCKQDAIPFRHFINLISYAYEWHYCIAKTVEGPPKR